MITSNQRKTGPIRGCLLPILGVVGFLALCYALCFVIYLLNIPFTQPGGTSGGMLLPPLY